MRRPLRNDVFSPSGQLLFVESNSSGTGRLFALRTREQGARPVLLASNPARYDFVRKEGIEAVSVDTGCDDALLQAARTLAQREPVVGVFSSSEYFIGAAGRLAQRLGLPGPCADAIQSCRHKHQQRLRLKDAGLPTPRFTLARSPEEAWLAARETGLPVILKPVLGTGSAGVRLCRSQAEVTAHATTLLNQRVNERGHPIPQEILVEEFIQGPEFSVESFHEKILGITRKHLTSEPWFVETGHDFPARLGDTEDAIHRAVLSALKALRLGWGPIHTELRLGKEGPLIIEINPRLAGGFIPELVGLATGIDPIQETIHAVTGRPVVLRPGRNCFASLRFIMARSDGLIDRISGIDAARAVPGVQAVEMYKAGGQECRITHDFRDRIGHVIAVADQSEGAEAAAGAADRARDAIAVRLRGDTGRLKKPPSPALRRILLETPPEVASADLMLISQVDLSHVLMLSECGIVGSAEANTLLKSILELRAAGFAPLRNRPQDRGLYLMYEEYLRDTCGERIGGMLQTGRSRNDLNATTARLKARMLVRRLMGEAFRLQAALIHAAESYTGTVMPAYTHGQAAVPITYGHYLAGSAEALSRELDHLLASIHDLSRCPLGAGAVGGTSFPIRPERSAELLGFSDTCANSLDAVASRDYVLRLLACAAGISVLLSRVAADYFQWCTAEFGFIELPDEMVGSSSAMPQKRNPFLLEHVAGRAGLTLGRYTSAAAAMLHAPFSNSIAVGTEAVKALSTALIETAECALLLRLVVRAARPNHLRMLESASRGHTVALELANRLVRDAGLDFRAAHRLTGELVNDCVERDGLLSDKGSADFLARRGLRVEVEDLTVPRVAAEARFGGGPAEEAVRAAIDGLKAVWFRQRAAYRLLRQRWSDSEAELLSAAAERAE